jgi:hypothetical protein
MCRLAALSDDNQAIVVAKWIATSQLGEYGTGPELSRKQFQLDPPDDAFRATG